MSESDISWESDREARFKQPPGFVAKEVGGSDGDCPSLASSCSECFGGTSFEDCANYTDGDGKEYKFWYPDNDEVMTGCTHVIRAVGWGGGGWAGGYWGGWVAWVRRGGGRGGVGGEDIAMTRHGIAQVWLLLLLSHFNSR